MASQGRAYDYLALDTSGRRVRGSLAASDDAGAYEQLKRQGFSPLSLRPARTQAGRRVFKSRLTDRDLAALLADLAALLKAGSNMRAALGVIGVKAERPAVRNLCRELTQDISGGSALEQAFDRVLGPRHAFVPALVSAGEASGDLAGGFERAADMLTSQIKLHEQLVSTLSYPAFILASSVAAVLVILLFVIPSLAPLVEQSGTRPPLIMQVLIATSDAVRTNARAAGVAAALLALAFLVARRLGLVASVFDRLMLDGPLKRTTCALVYGAFALSLGNMLSAGAPMAEALKLALRAVRSPTARSRIEPVTRTVRQGRGLSDALAKVRGFPPGIVRLASIGEASGGLGPMIARAGRLEEETAFRRLEAFGRMVGPLLIVGLGGLIGLVMAGLLSGLTSIGDTALQ